MGNSVLGSALAFIAFGANLMGTSVLLLFNPRDRVLRWYAVFTAVMLAWLAMQGVALADDLSPRGWWWFGLAVSMLPVAFLTVSLVQILNFSNRAAILFNIAAIGVLVFAVRDPLSWRYQLVWSAAGWGAGGVLHLFRGRARSARRARANADRNILDVTLNLLVPAGVIGALMLRENFIVYALPAVTIVTAFMLFLGIVYHRYYDIEVRAARSGDIGVGAAEQERLALLGEFSASIAHEVRNPLTGMKSLVQRLRDEDLDAEKRTRYLGVILDEIGRLDRIVTSLTDVARRPAPTPSSTGGASDAVTETSILFADLQLLVEARARAGGVTIVTNSPRGLRAAAPREALAQALLNLLLNAIAHAPSGTRVELSADRDNGSVVITVRDQGPGIDASERELVFQPFHTSSGGTGLGLAVVRSLARNHSWSIDIGDAPGGGAELRLTVPAWDVV